MIKPQTLKGFRDFMPGDVRKRQYVISLLQKVFESYGFEPLGTPTLEYEEILAGKYGEEGEKLMYRFTDNGQRRVAMRYDQTVPLARVVSQYQNILPKPFKRYQIQNVWRADNPQKGRYREFVMCDIDTVGLTSPAADGEVLAVIDTALQVLGFTDYRILINDRSVFGNLPIAAITIIDKLKKIGVENVKKELTERGFNPEALTKIQSAQMPESLKTITELAAGMGSNVEKFLYEPTLARGLDYYTGLIIEVEIPTYTAGSVGGGGRYDNLLGLFSNQSIPAVGFAFGFDRIIEAMSEQNLFPDATLSTASALVTIFNPTLTSNSMAIAEKLRANGILTELWLDSNTKMEKQLKYADQKNIPYVIVIGPEEAANNIVTLKIMKTRKQEQLTIEDAIKKISHI